MFGLGTGEMIIVLVIAVLLFGKRLPDVAKSLGKGVREFRDGVRGIEGEFHAEYSTPSSSTSRVPHYEERDEPTAPRFEPPPAAEPQEQSQAAEKVTA